MSKENVKIIADILHNLDQRAVQALTEQRYEDALAVYEEVLKAETELKLEKERGHTLLNMANTLLALNRPEEAIKYLDTAADITEIAKNEKDNTMLQIFRANTMVILGRQAEAERMLSDKLKTCKNPLLIGQMELLRFQIYWKNSERSKARASVDRAIRCFELAANKEELKRAIHCRIQFFDSVGQGMYAAGDRTKLRMLMENDN